MAAEEGEDAAAADNAGGRRQGGLQDNNRPPDWGRFSAETKQWCEQHNFRSVHAARTAWVKVEANHNKCFWTNSELGKVMGGECNRGNNCKFADTHE